MLCYAMLCYAMLCYAMLCYVMLCYANVGMFPWPGAYIMSCYTMHATLCYHYYHYSMVMSWPVATESADAPVAWPSTVRICVTKDSMAKPSTVRTCVTKESKYMLCYAMLCYIVCYAYAMLCYVIL